MRNVILTAAGILFPHLCAFASALPQTPAASSVPASSTVTDVPSLSQELARISKLLDNKPSPTLLTDLRNSLPNQWTINTPERTYSVPTDYLRSQLAAGSAENAKAWSDFLAAKLRGYAAEGPASPASSRAELDRILAGPEFASVHPPSAWDLFRQRLNAWLIGLFTRLFRGLSRHPIGGKIVFWLIVVAGVGFIALTLLRFVMARDGMESMPSQNIVVAHRTWQEWIRAVRDAATRNDFREAVRSAYWAGVTRLQDSGALPRDQSKTPREYLQALSEPYSAEGPSASRTREALSILTNRLEQIWYADRRASSDDLSVALRQLETLGCQLE
jgi:hypothetical protein